MGLGMNKFFGFVGAVAVAAALSTPASAAVLTFDGDICDGGGVCTNFGNIDASYGDIAGQLDVQYQSDINNVSLIPYLEWWDTAYSDLQGVAFSASGGTGEIYLQPLSGYKVTLTGFDLGSWPNVDRQSQYSIRGGNGDLLFSSGEITILGSVRTHVGGSYTRADGIRIQFGPESYNVGIDNIAFTVTPTGAVPEPATWALMIGGFGAAGAMLRRRRTPAVA